MGQIEFENNLMRLQDNMLNFAYTLTANREDAKDLLQETTLKVLDKREKFVNDTNFKGWVFTIMKNIFINNYRKIVRDQTVNESSDSISYANISQQSGFETPDGAYSINEINKCINGFAKEYRVPFSMHVAGFKYQEIADEMKLPIGTVKSRIFFARQRLQELLKDYVH